MPLCLNLAVMPLLLKNVCIKEKGCMATLLRGGGLLHKGISNQNDSCIILIMKEDTIKKTREERIVTRTDGQFQDGVKSEGTETQYRI